MLHLLLEQLFHQRKVELEVSVVTCLHLVAAELLQYLMQMKYCREHLDSSELVKF